MLTPVSIAAWVGCTRVIDYYHNASDVLAGGLIGAAIALLTFYVIFPWGRMPQPKHPRASSPQAADVTDASDVDLPV